MDQQQLLDRLRETDRPVVIDVWAPWCGPCRAVTPHLERLAGEYDGRVDLWKINADEEPGLVEALGVRGIPTMITYRGQEEVARLVGAQSPGRLAGLFEAGLSGEAPVPVSLTPRERAVRVVAGLALLAWAWGGGGWLLAVQALGGLLVLSGVWDLLPGGRGLARRLGASLEEAQRADRAGGSGLTRADDDNEEGMP